MKPKKLKKLRQEELFLSKYTKEVLQSALERSARVHPPLYQCKHCLLQFKELASFAPHQRHFEEFEKCRSLKQIVSRGRYKEIIYTDQFFNKEHSCITVNPKYVPSSDNEIIEERSKEFDVDTIKKDFNPDDYEYRLMGSYWSEPDPETGEVVMLHPNEYAKYQPIRKHMDTIREIYRKGYQLKSSYQALIWSKYRDCPPVNQLIEHLEAVSDKRFKQQQKKRESFEQMIHAWCANSLSIIDDDYQGSKPDYIKVINTNFRINKVEVQMHQDWLDWMESIKHQNLHLKELK